MVARRPETPGGKNPESPGFSPLLPEEAIVTTRRTKVATTQKQPHLDKVQALRFLLVVSIYLGRSALSLCKRHFDVEFR